MCKGVHVCMFACMCVALLFHVSIVLFFLCFSALIYTFTGTAEEIVYSYSEKKKRKKRKILI